MDTAKRMGFISLYDEQKEAVLSFVGHKDVLVLLPTGRGKSLCYPGHSTDIVNGQANGYL